LCLRGVRGREVGGRGVERVVGRGWVVGREVG
jgi:hypothetical protein